MRHIHFGIGILLCLFFIANAMFAQDKTAKTDSIKDGLFIKHVSIEGVVTDRDSKTKEPIFLANVILYQGPNIISKTVTDFDGKYIVSIENLDLMSEYSLKASFPGYDTTFTGLHLFSKEVFNLTSLSLTVNIELESCIIVTSPCQNYPATNFPTHSGKTFYEDDLKHSPY